MTCRVNWSHKKPEGLTRKSNSRLWVLWDSLEILSIVARLSSNENMIVSCA